MTETSTRSNPRAARTRAALLTAGLDLLAERPIDAIAIDEVVARAGVAKGSFFNHFADKQAFGHAAAAAVRAEVEQRVTLTNAGVADPLMRLAGGMLAGLAFALERPRDTVVMLRNLEMSTARDHWLNRGISADIEAAVAAGAVRPEAATSGVRYWLGLCQVAMLNAIERRLGVPEAADRLGEMVLLALTGLGAGEERSRAVASHMAERLRLGKST
jgi:AcrR family transcriptional regulator